MHLLEGSEQLSSIDYHQQLTEVRPALALPLSQLSVAYGLLHRPCTHQLTKLEGNLSDLIYPAINSLHVFV